MNVRNLALLKSRRNMLIVTLLVASLFLPFVIGGYWNHILIVIFYYIVMASSWNLLAGFTGQFSFGHLGFALVGGYASGLLTHYIGIPVALGIFIAGLSGAACGFLLGGVVLRLKGSYLFLVTYGFAVIVRRILLVEWEITYAVMGLKVPFLFGTVYSPFVYYLFWAFALITVSIIALILRSRIGLYLKAIREDEEAAAVLGVNVVKWKLFSFTLSSTIASISGAVYAHYLGIISPEVLSFLEMGLVTTMVVIGGMGTIIGPILGSTFIEVTSETIRPIGLYRFIIFGAIMILIMKFLRGGLWEAIQKIYKRVRIALKKSTS